MHIMALTLLLLSVEVGFIQVQNVIHCTYQFCASPGFNYVKCIVEGARYIVNATVFNRTTSSSCDGILMSGYRDNFVWVDYGCHAYFDVCAAYRASTLTLSTSLATSMIHRTSSPSTIQQPSTIVSQQLTPAITIQQTSTKNLQQITTTDTGASPLLSPATALMSQETSASTAVMPTTVVQERTRSSERSLKAEETTTTNAEGSSGISSNTAIMAGALAAGFAFLAVGIGFSKFMLSRNAVTRVSPLAREGHPRVQERGTSMSPDVSEIARPAFDTTKLAYAFQNGL